MSSVDLTDKSLLGRLEAMSAEELVGWAFENFGERAAIGTSLQLTGTVIIDIASKRAESFRVFTVDTLRLHDETYESIAKTEERYGIEVERFYPNEQRLIDMVSRFGEYLFFTDKAKQEYCCEVRKVEPNKRALRTLDCWISGLRRDQSAHRGGVAKAEVVDVEGRSILKLNPLADWSLDEVWRYIKDNGLVYNKLFDKNYDSIGCVICSTPLVEGEAPRAGRWRWFGKCDDEKKECGIHIKNEKGEAK